MARQSAATERMTKAVARTASILLSLIVAVQSLSCGSAAASTAANPVSGETPMDADPMGVIATSSSRFIENLGQLTGDIRFYMRGNPAIAFRDDGIMFVLRGEREAGHSVSNGGQQPFAPSEDATSTAFFVRFEGANRVRPVGLEKLPLVSNFFIGSKTENWRTHVPSYAAVKYPSLYDGIDLMYTAESGGVKYEFMVHPGGSPSSISMGYEGVQSVGIDERGIVVHTSLSEIRDSAPVSYQGGEGVDCRFVLRGTYSFGFDCGEYDRSRTLLIDPYVFATFLGGGDLDRAYSVTSEMSGSPILAGVTWSPDFPTTPGAFNQSYSGNSDIFVARLSRSGDAIIFATYIGGNSSEDAAFPQPERGDQIAVDPNGGTIFVAGITNSSDFPVTPTFFDDTYNGGIDAFLVGLGHYGDQMLLSTYFGGSGDDAASSIAINPGSGQVFIVGTTDSADLPTSAGAYDRTINGLTDAFVARFGTFALDFYSTYLGGLEEDRGFAIAVDHLDNLYVTGTTWSADFPTTTGAYGRTMRGPNDAFVTKLTSTVDSLIYSTYLGGNDSEQGFCIGVNWERFAFVAGETNSTDFPTTIDAPSRVYGGNHDVFISKLNLTGSTLLNSTYIGGSERDEPRSIEVVFNSPAMDLAGLTWSADFPTTPYAPDRTHNSAVQGYSDAFLLSFNGANSSLYFSTFIGGSGNDSAEGVFYDDAVCDDYWFYTVGYTDSADFPVTADAFDKTLESEDAFMVSYWTTFNFPPDIPLPICIDGLCSDSVDSRLYHLTKKSSFVLNWTYLEADGDPQVMAEVTIATGINRTGVVWTTRSMGPATQMVYSGPPLLPCTEYWYSVATYDFHWSELAQLRFRTNCPPAGLNRVSPLDGAVISQRPDQRVSWSFATDSDPGDILNYTWKVATSSTFTPPLVSTGTTRRNYSDPFQTQSPLTYYWCVNVTDGWEWVDECGSPWAFSVTNLPLPYAYQLELDGYPLGSPYLQHVTNHAPILSWGFYPNYRSQTAFHIEVRRQSDDSIAWSLNESGLGGSQSQVAYDSDGTAIELSDGTCYYLRVKVRDNVVPPQWGEWSAGLDFCLNTPPPTPVPLAPAKGDVRPPGITLVYWGEVADADSGDSVSYEYCVGTSDPPYPDCNVVHGGSLVNSSYPFTTLEGMTYRWAVKAFDAHEYSPWSVVWDFNASHVKTNDAPVITLDSPPSLESGSLYDISWSMGDDATPDSELVVYLNYSYSGETHTIAGPLQGTTSYAWSVPSIDRSDVRIVGTVIDEEGLHGTNQTSQFGIHPKSNPPNTQIEWSILIGIAVAVIIVGTISIVVFTVRRRRKE